MDKQHNIFKDIHMNTQHSIDRSKLFTISRKIQKQLHNPSGSPVLITNSIEDIINSTVFFTIKSHPINLLVHPIHHNNLLKFGKQIYRVKIHYSNLNNKENKIKILEYNYLYDSVHYQEKMKNQLKTEEKQQQNMPQSVQHQKQCKICLSIQGRHSKDYMISPCRCSGSCSVVHLQCLKCWIGQKIQISSKKSHKLRSFDLSKFQCEICKMSYPKLINVNDQFIDIIPEIELNNNKLLNSINHRNESNKNNQSIIILQKLFPLQSNKKITHVIQLSQSQKLSMGRNIQNQLILQDMSVSRFHAQIIYKDNKFYLIDRDSRFGTFMSLNQQQQMKNLSQGVLLTAKQNFVFKMVEKEKEEKSSVIELEESANEAEIEDILNQYEDEEQGDSGSSGVINEQDDDIINEIEDQMENYHEGVYIVHQSYQQQQQHQ